MPAERVKSAQVLDSFVQLRVVVGFLGSGKQAGWWKCDLLDQTGLRFLENVFPRTYKAAALRSTTEAACMVHDRSLGRVGNYHLFRLPPALEDRLEHIIEKLDWSQPILQIQSRDVAIDMLRKLSNGIVLKAPEGPVQIGVQGRMLTENSVQELAAHYFSAFQSGIQCFPYFAPEKNAR